MIVIGVSFLVSSGCTYYHKSNPKDILKESEAGNIAEVKALLDKVSDLHPVRFNMALYFASSEGHLEIVEMLLDKGANVNYMNYTDKTPLITASINGHLDIVQVLLDYGADVNLTRSYDRRYNHRLTALSFALERGHLDIVKTLHDKGTTLLQSELNDLYIIAAQQGDTTYVKRLIEEGAFVNYKTPISRSYISSYTTDGLGSSRSSAQGGNTALIHAVIGEHYETVQYLLNIGADKYIQDCFDKTALDYASKDIYLLFKGN